MKFYMLGIVTRKLGYVAWNIYEILKFNTANFMQLKSIYVLCFDFKIKCQEIQFVNIYKVQIFPKDPYNFVKYIGSFSIL